MKFRKKPVVIEAMKLTLQNIAELILWINAGLPDEAMARAHKPYTLDAIQIRTLEGYMIASVGDWIIKGVKGEFYPIKDDIFRATYEPVTQNDTICEGT